jgi:hypothetical protein
MRNLFNDHSAAHKQEEEFECVFSELRLEVVLDLVGMRISRAVFGIGLVHHKGDIEVGKVEKSALELEVHRKHVINEHEEGYIDP